MKIIRHNVLTGIVSILFIVPVAPLSQDSTVTISGSVSYSDSLFPVDSIRIIIKGEVIDSCYTDSEGQYQCTGIPLGFDYILFPEKGHDDAPVTAFDASLIFPNLTNTVPLSSYDSLAADVTQDGTISALDADLILRYIVLDICDHSQTILDNCIGSWCFNPDSIRYDSLRGNQSDQDFVGVVCGDVSGNWKHHSCSEDTVEVESSWRGRYLTLHFWMPTVDSLMIYSGQYVMNFGNDILSVREIIADCGALGFYMCSGKLSIAWAETEPQMQYAGPFTIVIQISDDARPGQEVSLCFESMMINETAVWVKTTGETIIIPGSKGDINWDGSTDAMDVVLAIRHALKIEALVDDAFRRADCYGDGYIDITDVMGIVNEILRLGKCGP